jgi:hypothetical protein
MLAGVKRALCLLAGALAFAGCDSGDSGGDPEAIKGAPKQVAGAVTTLDAATRAGRYGEICDRLFTRAARARAGGGDCEALLRSATEDVRRPRVRLLSIRVKGDTAQARVRTRSAGERAVDETIALRRERGRYRIASLSP